MLRSLKSALLVSVFAGSAHGHGVADNHLQVMIVDDRVKVNITVDMRVLSSIDTDNDGYTSLDELRDNRKSLDAWFDERVRIRDQSGSSGAVVFSDVTTDLNLADNHGGRFDHARIVRTIKLDDQLDSLWLNAQALQSIIPELRVTLIDAATGKKYRLSDPGRAQWIAIPSAAH